jgi:hypothetical protein
MIREIVSNKLPIVDCRLPIARLVTLLNRQLEIGNRQSCDCCAKFTSMLLRRTTLLPVLIASLLVTSCSNSLFKVKPVTELPPISTNSRTATAGNTTIRVAPFLNDEECQELFEANLLLIGILPLRVELTVQNDVAMRLDKAKVRLTDSQGRQWKYLTAKQAASRIKSANGIKLYNPNAKKKFEEDMEAYGVDLKSPLNGPETKRTGFFFFQTPDKRAVASGQQFVLSIEKLPQPLTITLQ